MLSNTKTRFADEIIKVELKQPHIKLIFVALQALSNQIDAGISPDQFKSLLESTKKNIGSNLPKNISDDFEIFKNEFYLVIDAFVDAYVDKKMKYVNMFLADINQHFDENYERDIFDLAEGETLKIEDSGTVYG